MTAKRTCDYLINTNNEIQMIQDINDENNDENEKNEISSIIINKDNIKKIEKKLTAIANELLNKKFIINEIQTTIVQYRKNLYHALNRLKITNNHQIQELSSFIKVLTSGFLLQKLIYKNLKQNITYQQIINNNSEINNDIIDSFFNIKKNFFLMIDPFQIKAFTFQDIYHNEQIITNLINDHELTIIFFTIYGYDEIVNEHVNLNDKLITIIIQRFVFLFKSDPLFKEIKNTKEELNNLFAFINTKKKENYNQNKITYDLNSSLEKIIYLKDLFNEYDDENNNYYQFLKKTYKYYFSTFKYLKKKEFDEFLRFYDIYSFSFFYQDENNIQHQKEYNLTAINDVKEILTFFTNNIYYEDLLFSMCLIINDEFMNNYINKNEFISNYFNNELIILNKGLQQYKKKFKFNTVIETFKLFNIQKKQNEIDLNLIQNESFIFLFQHLSIDNFYILKKNLYENSFLKINYNLLIETFNKIDNVFNEENKQKLPIKFSLTKILFEENLLNEKNLMIDIITYQKNVYFFLDNMIHNHETNQQQFEFALTKYCQLIKDGQEIDNKIDYFAKENVYVKEMKANDCSYQLFTYTNFKIPVASKITFINEKEQMFINFVDIKTIIIFFKTCFPPKTNNIENYNDDFLLMNFTNKGIDIATELNDEELNDDYYQQLKNIFKIK